MATSCYQNQVLEWLRYPVKGAGAGRRDEDEREIGRSAGVDLAVYELMSRRRKVGFKSGEHITGSGNLERRR